MHFCAILLQCDNSTRGFFQLYKNSKVEIFIVNFEHTSHFFPVFLLFKLGMCLRAGVWEKHKYLRSFDFGMEYFTQL